MKTGSIFLTDGGLETDLIFNHGIDLPHFAAFPLIEKPKYKSVMRAYYKEYLEIAKNQNTGFILESPTWRANKDWGYKLGYSVDDLDNVNQKAISQLVELREEYQESIPNTLISGQLGPRGDGYEIDFVMSADEAKDYHTAQINSFATAKADLVSALTMTYCNEALGIVKAAKEHNIDVVISFTVELDGKLPSGETLEECINSIDEETNSYPLYYMINCAHPSHFIEALQTDKLWKNRIQGVRANASCKSHAELDESTELDAGDTTELANWHTTLKNSLPELKVYGGCCGTDASHIEAISKNVA